MGEKTELLKFNIIKNVSYANICAKHTHCIHCLNFVHTQARRFVYLVQLSEEGEPFIN